jgi:hypothetical protein
MGAANISQKPNERYTARISKGCVRPHDSVHGEYVVNCRITSQKWSLYHYPIPVKGNQLENRSARHSKISKGLLHIYRFGLRSRVHQFETSRLTAFEEEETEILAH